MFGIDFGESKLAPLLLPDGFEGHPLRKEFVLASRVVKPWPGAKEPGGVDRRRRGAIAGPPAQSSRRAYRTDWWTAEDGPRRAR